MRADRQRLIRLIHVAKRNLQLDDDTYRAPRHYARQH